MDKLRSHSGVAAPLNLVNVDTDMIIPKQYLKVTPPRLPAAPCPVARQRRSAEGATARGGGARADHQAVRAGRGAVRGDAL